MGRLEMLRGLARPGFSVLDQGLQAAISLCMTVLMGRYGGVDAMGAYAAVYVVVVAARSLHECLVLQPMSVMAPRIDGKAREEYDRFVAAVALWLPLSIAALGALLVAALAATTLPTRAYGLAIITCLGYTVVSACAGWIRRQHYVNGAPWLALQQSAWTFLVTLGCAAAIGTYSHLTSISAFACLLAGSVVAVAIHGVRGGEPRFHLRLPASARSLAAQHWRFGRWAALGIPFTVLTFQGYYLIATATLGIEAVGILKALDCFVAPFEQLLIAMGLLLLPDVARRIDGLLPEEQRRLLVRLSSQFIALALVYCVAAWISRYLVLSRLLRLDPAALAKGLDALPVILVVPILKSTAYPPAIVLLARLRTDLTLRAYIAASVMTLTLGVMVTTIGGLKGAATGMVLSAAAFSASLWYSALVSSRTVKARESATSELA